MKCQWTNEAENAELPADCGHEATHTTCDPIGGVVCEAHRCRCSKPLAKQEGWRANYVGAPAYYVLQHACRVIVEAYGPHLYLVGSALRKRDHRDVDLRLILPDEEFDALFPGLSSSSWSLDARWSLLAVSISTYLAEQSGLPVDFQIQRQTEANLWFSTKDGHGRHPIGYFLEPSKDDGGTT